MKGDFIMGKLREQMKMDLELQSSKQVLEYLGCYSHRVAISSYRLIKVEDGKVTLSKSESVGWEELLFKLTGIDPCLCPCCKKGRMVTREILSPQGPAPPGEVRWVA